MRNLVYFAMYTDKDNSTLTDEDRMIIDNILMDVRHLYIKPLIGILRNTLKHVHITKLNLLLLHVSEEMCLVPCK